MTEQEALKLKFTPLEFETVLPLVLVVKYYN